MKSLLTEFKAFAIKGNVVDLAVAVVIGAAFGKIVSSLVDNIITPLMGVLLGGVDFSGYTLTIGEVSVTYGVFIQSIVDFLIVAAVIFFVVKAINKVQAKEAKKPEKEKVVETPEDIRLLREIRDALQK